MTGLVTKRAPHWLTIGTQAVKPSLPNSRDLNRYAVHGAASKFTLGAVF